MFNLGVCLFHLLRSYILYYIPSFFQIKRLGKMLGEKKKNNSEDCVALNACWIFISTITNSNKPGNLFKITRTKSTVRNEKSAI